LNDLLLDHPPGSGAKFDSVEHQPGRQWPGAVGTRPKHVCAHPNRHEFYCWSSKDDAVYQRGLMARNPHYERLYISEVYAGSLGGWAWAVCWSCPRLEEDTTT
jgi:hypothetical protein